MTAVAAPSPGSLGRSVNSRTAEVVAVKGERVTFRLEDGKTLELRQNDPQLRHLDHAWASTVHAFQGRTVDNVIAAMEARHPHLTTQKSFYVEISRARDRAELVTDDAKDLRAQLEAVTGERIAALEAIGGMPREEPGRAADGARAEGRQPERNTERAAGRAEDRSAKTAKDREMPAPEGPSRPQRGAGDGIGKGRQAEKSPAKAPEPPSRGRGKGDMDLGL